MQPVIKIYGERNTGTNYLSRLLKRNLGAKLLRGVVPWYVRIPFPQSETARDLYFELTWWRNLGWKHRLAPSPDLVRKSVVYSDKLFFATITKNPYSWLLSLYRHPYHYQGNLGTFQQFLSTPWRSVRRAKAPTEYPNPMIMWNAKNGAYLRLRAGAPTALLRYEDLLADPELVLAKLASQFSIDRNRSSFENIIDSTKEPGGGKSFHFYQQYYLREQWKAELQPAALQIINQHLDFDVVAQFGYERIEAV